MLVRNAYTHDSRVEKEARSLVDAGFRVTVVADARAGLPSRERRDGADVVRVARGGPGIPGLRFLVHQLRLGRRLDRLAPDILHAHDSDALAPVAIAAARRGIPFVYDAHELWLGRPRREHARLYFALSQLWYRFVQRFTVPRAAAVLTVSAPIADHLQRQYRLASVRLVPNYPDSPAALVRRELGELGPVDPGRPIVLYLGGLMRNRGLEVLVDAIALRPEVQLVLLGDGLLGEDLLLRAEHAGARDRTLLLAAVPPGEVVAYAASADVGVSAVIPTSLNDRYSLPNKLFQYMAAGIPVVASDLPQVREVLESAGAGMVVDTSRPQAIADAIGAILRDPAEARAMGERGRAAVIDRFNWSVSAAVLVDAYASI